MRVPDEYWHGHWLAEDESEGVRREVIKNANTTVPLLENLAVDEDKGGYANMSIGGGRRLCERW